ncbi:Uncharacterised protein at_DN0110, partial [Pycnogonum litorale]
MTSNLDSTDDCEVQEAQRQRPKSKRMKSMPERFLDTSSEDEETGPVITQKRQAVQRKHIIDTSHSASENILYLFLQQYQSLSTFSPVPWMPLTSPVPQRPSTSSLPQLARPSSSASIKTPGRSTQCHCNCQCCHKH